jgi:hypothetical protein
MNPPAKRLGSSKGKRMARRRRRGIRRGVRRVKRAGRRAGRTGKKFLGLSMPIVETGAASAAGILGTNFITGFALQKLSKNGTVPAEHWTRQWYSMVGIKVATAVALAYGLRKAKMGRFSNAVLAGGLSSAALSLARKFAPPAMFETRFGLAGDDPADLLAGNNVSADLSGLGALVDSNEAYGIPSGLDGLTDSAGIYAQMN